MRRLVFVGVTALVFGGFACNAIIGVEDVKLRSDGGEVFVDDRRDPDPPDTAVPPQDGASPLVHDNRLEVALGELFSCARKPDFGVKCWGDDTFAQTGTNGVADGGLLLVPTPVLGITDAVQIGAGKRHACAVRQSGAVACWGYNLDGQLGDGTSNGRSAKPVVVKDLDDAFAVVGGGNFTCALKQNGTVACWGGNGQGQLGIGSATTKTTPQPVTGLTDVRAIAAGESHACAMTADGSVSCWGDGASGQNGGSSSIQVPTKVAGVAAVAIAAGGKSSYAVTKDGRVLAWGANDVGQLGNGTTSTLANPAPVTAKVTGASAVAAGPTNACALLATGAVQCWGAAAAGQLGDGKMRDAGAVEANPQPVSGITMAKGAGAGGGHACAPTATGAISCWGANGRGQLGANKASATPEYAPIAVTGYP